VLTAEEWETTRLVEHRGTSEETWKRAGTFPTVAADWILPLLMKIKKKKKRQARENVDK
jgi:hypothetical protein